MIELIGYQEYYRWLGYIDHVNKHAGHISNFNQEDSSYYTKSDVYHSYMLNKFYFNLFNFEI